MVVVELTAILLLATNVAVVKATNCWQISISIHYTVGPTVVNVTENDANVVLNEVLNHGISQLSCPGIMLKLLNFSIETPGNLYTITGGFGIMYGSMNASQKSTAKACLARADIFNAISLRPDYYLSPMKGYMANRVTFTNYQDTLCCFNGTVPSNGVCVVALTTAAPTTQAPTTQAPTTQTTTTQAPTTQAPTTQAPTTQAPTTQTTTRQSPTTQASTTQVPRTQSPTTQAPTSPVYLNFVNFVTRKLINRGDTARLFCAVHGTASNIEVTWKSDGNRLDSNIKHFQDGLNYTKALLLTITEVTTSKAGAVYICEVSSSIGTMKRNLTLDVRVSSQVNMEMVLSNKVFHPDLSNSSSPKHSALSEEFKTQGKRAFSSENLGFTVTGIEVNGFSEGSIIVDFTIFMSQVLSVPTDSPPNLVQDVIEFMLNQVKKGTFGNYSVSNDSLFLRVLPPPPVIKTENNDRGIKYITIKWTAPQNWESYRITSYIIKYKKKESSMWDEEIVGSNILEKKIEGLEKQTKYDFMLYSRNSVGLGPSSSVSFTTLSVNPIIANNGQKFSARKGETVVLVCTASSNPKPQEVKWTYPPISAQVHENETRDTLNIYMTIKNVTEENAGAYECRTSYNDAKGNGTVFLDVIVPVEVRINATLANQSYTPELKNKFSPQFKKLEKLFVTQLTKLYNNTEGFKRVEVLEFINGSVKVVFRVIVEVKVSEPKQLNKPNEAKVRVTTTITKKIKATDGDLGEGIIFQKNSVQSNAPPPSPRNLTVRDVQETMAHLRWQEPDDAYAFSIHNYTIKLKKFGQTWEEKVTTQHTDLDSRISQLQKDTKYSVKVFAKGNGGQGLDSEVEEFETKEAKVNLLTYLWICLALLLVAAVIVFVVHKHKKKTNADRRYYANGQREKNQKRTSVQFPSDEKNVQVYSYQNVTFGLTSLDFESLGLMPGKWWEIPRRQLSLERTLGSGAFGMVKKGILQLDNGPMPCAVKMLKVAPSKRQKSCGSTRHSAGEEETRDLINELEIIAGVGTHPNLVNLIGACTYGHPFLIVLEFVEGGSLIDYVRDNVTIVAGGGKASSLPHEEKLQIALDIAKGMQHLAHVKCIHRDLAARNILLTGNHRAKIADFGMSRDVYERGFYVKQSQGKLPVRWMSPEAIEQMKFTTKGDVWSYGVLLWEMESGGKLPYGGVGKLELMDYIKKGQRLPRPSRCTESVYNIMLYCWYINPDDRPSFDDLCGNMEELLSQTTVDLQADVFSPRYE